MGDVYPIDRGVLPGHFPDLLEDHEMEKLRTKKDECVPQSIEPIEFKVSFPKIHPSDPEKLGMEIFKDKN
jgi:hypothetical protein